MSEALRTEVIERNGKTYQVTLHSEESVENPLEWGSVGTIHSYSSRHVNYSDVEPEEVAKNSDAVFLSYFEHGRCRWSVQGDTKPGEEFQFDGVSVAGYWEPDASVLADAPQVKAERRAYMIDQATEAVRLYTAYCNGDSYRWEINELVTCSHGDTHEEHYDSCGGYLDDEDYAWASALEALPQQEREKVSIQ